MHAGLGFRNSAVVGLDLRRPSLDENALRGFAARGNQNALRNGRVGVAHGDGNFGGGVAGVREVDGDDPSVGLRPRSGIGRVRGVRCPIRRSEKDVVDRDVRQSLVGIDPIGEEP